MKKLLLLLFTMFVACSVNAQFATENAKMFDNTYIGVTVGASTPLDFNSVFPLNPVAGLKVGKEFTPVFGTQIEGLAVLNDNHFADIKTAMKAVNVSTSGTINLTNLFYGYDGTSRPFEVSTVTGLGWLYSWDVNKHNLSAKTGLDLALNAKHGHSFVLTPAVYWNLDKLSKIQFNKHKAQLALTLSYVYHFKTSNGTHNFKLWNVGAMIQDINDLRAALAEKSKEIVRVKHEVRYVTNTPVVNPFIVAFAKNSYELTESAKDILDQIPIEVTVDIIGTASPEGTEKYNQTLSEKRAEAVAEYLKANHVKVDKVVGIGTDGDDSQRIVMIAVK